MFSVVGFPVPLNVTVSVFLSCPVDIEPFVVPWMFLVLVLMLAARVLSAPGASALGRSTFETLANVAGIRRRFPDLDCI
jgi:hypothetical protein